PSVQGIRLGVVVAVEEQRHRGAGHSTLAEDRGVAAGLEHTPRQAALGQLRGEPCAGDANFLRLLAHRLEAKELEKALDDRATARDEQAIERRPVRHGTNGSIARQLTSLWSR